MYSYSAINEYENCPRKYKLKRIDKLVEPSSTALVVGDKVHTLIAEYLSYCRDNAYPTYYAFEIPVLESAIEDEVRSIMDTFIKSHVFDWNLMQTCQIEQPIAYNKEWARVDWDSPEAWMRLKRDQLHIENDMCVITDFKTNRAIDFTPDAFEKKPLTELLQLAIYAYSAYLEYPDMERFLIRLDFVRYGMGGIRKRLLTKDEILSVPEILNGKIHIVEGDGEYLPRVSDYCNYCAFVSRCPEGKRVFEDSGDSLIVTAADASGAAERLKMAKVIAGKLEKQLRVYVENNGPVDVAHESLDYHVSNVTKYFFQDVYKTLTEAHVSPAEIFAKMDLSQTATENLLKALDKKQLMTDLDPLKEQTSQTAFKFKKRKEK